MGLENGMDETLWHCSRLLKKDLRRNKASLRAKILGNNLPGTTIVTDQWGAYNSLATWVARPMLLTFTKRQTTNKILLILQQAFIHN